MGISTSLDANGDLGMWSSIGLGDPPVEACIAKGEPRP